MEKLSVLSDWRAAKAAVRVTDNLFYLPFQRQHIETNRTFLFTLFAVSLPLERAVSRVENIANIAKSSVDPFDRLKALRRVTAIGLARPIFAELLNEVVSEISKTDQDPYLRGTAIHVVKAWQNAAS